MKVLAYIHMYVPLHNAGAEHMAHAFLRHLAANGHEVTVVATQTPEHYEYEGVQVTNDYRNQDLFQWADVVVTHLDMTSLAIRHARAARKPLVHWVHNDKQLQAGHVRYPDAALVVFNSHWLVRAVRWAGPKTVIHPPVNFKDYEVNRAGAKALTLVNLYKEKGAAMFWDLARRMPDHEFLAVTGAYGTQELSELDNVTVLPHTPDILSVYARTRVLLMPSKYESWGRTAIEAASSGIPTIATPVPGLVESLGSAGIFANLDDLDAWEREIRRLDDTRIYLEHSARAVGRAQDLEPSADLERFEDLLGKVVRRDIAALKTPPGSPDYAIVRNA